MWRRGFESCGMGKGGGGDDEDKEDGGDDEDEEEEEEEEEPVDPKPALEEGKSLPNSRSMLSHVISGRLYCIQLYHIANINCLTSECAKSSQCRGYKHHYDECVERVTAHENDPDAHKKGHKEDCVEECKFIRPCIWQIPIQAGDTRKKSAD